MNTLRSLLVLLLAMLAFPAISAPFQIKGLTLGMPVNSACGSSSVTDTLGDIVREHMASEESLLLVKTSECKIDLGSFGRLPIAGLANLLFLDGRLILLKFDINNISTADAANLLRSLHEEYGKPRRVVDRPFVTDTWRQNSQSLSFERSPGEGDDNDMILILKDDAGMKIYEGQSRKVKRELDRQIGNSRRNDMR